MRVDGESGGERFRSVFEPLDAQELVAQGLLGPRRRGVSQEVLYQDERQARIMRDRRATRSTLWVGILSSVLRRAFRLTPMSRRLLVWAVLLGTFVLCDLGLFGWLIFRTLSQREINRVILETREEAQQLARQIATGIEGRNLDLATAVVRQA